MVNSDGTVTSTDLGNSIVAEGPAYNGSGVDNFYAGSSYTLNTAVVQSDDAQITGGYNGQYGSTSQTVSVQINWDPVSAYIESSSPYNQVYVNQYGYDSNGQLVPNDWVVNTGESLNIEGELSGTVLSVGPQVAGLTTINQIADGLAENYITSNQSGTYTPPTIFNTPSYSSWSIETITQINGGSSDNFITTSSDWSNIVDAGAGNDTIMGLYGSPGYFYGGDGRDLIFGSNPNYGGGYNPQNDVLVASGDDYLGGDGGNNTYLILPGYTGMSIIDSATENFSVDNGWYRAAGLNEYGTDTVQFNSGINLSDLTFSYGTFDSSLIDDGSNYGWGGGPQTYQTLNISWALGSGIEVVLPQYSDQYVQDDLANNPGDSWGVEYFTFADGTTLTMDQMLALANTQLAAQTDTAPVLSNASDDQNINLYTTFTYQLPQNTFTDADGDNLTYYATLSDGSALPDWLTFDAANRTLTGTPADNIDAGTIEVRIVATDSAGLSAWDTFGITVNPAFTSWTNPDGSYGDKWCNPDGSSGSDYFYTDGSQDHFVVANGVTTETWSAPDGSYGTNITYDDGTTSVATVYGDGSSETAVTYPNGTESDKWVHADGSVTDYEVYADGSRSTYNTILNPIILPSPPLLNPTFLPSSPLITPSISLTYYSADGSYAYFSVVSGVTTENWSRPDGSSGSDVISSDGTVLTMEQMVALAESQFGSSANNAPATLVVNSAIADQTIDQYATFTYQIPANTFSDANGGNLAYTATMSDGSALPSWLTFDPVSQTFSGTPVDNDAGALRVMVTATDSGGLTASGSFDITVDPRTFTSWTNADGSSGDSWTKPDGTSGTDYFYSDGSQDHFVVANGITTETWSNPDGSSGTNVSNADGTVYDTTFNADGSSSDYYTLADGSSYTDYFNADGSQQHYVTTADGVTTETWSDPDGSSGKDVIYSDGSELDSVTNADGSTAVYYDNGSSYLHYSSAAGSAYIVDVNGVATETWTKPDGSSGSNVVNTGYTAVSMNEMVSMAEAALSGVTNIAPVVANAIFDQSVDQYAAFTYQVPAGTFSDVDGDILTYSATMGDGSALPSWLTFDPSTATFTGTPVDNDAGTLQVMITAADSGGLAVSDTFDITVNARTFTSWTNPDGSSGNSWSKPDGSSGSDYYYADGSQVHYVIANGVTTETWSKPDGSSGTDVTNADGTVYDTTLNADGSTSDYYTHTDGSSYSDYFYTNGSQVHYAVANGVTTETWSNSSGNTGIDITNSDGSCLSYLFDATGLLSSDYLKGTDGLTRTDSFAYNADGTFTDTWAISNGTSGTTAYASTIDPKTVAVMP